ncbi:MAG TPA: FapA family protein, partial [bacterium]|nr:FapA family protein [bacterium]
DRISVEDLYKVDAVNSTTGNVRFNGVVQVVGNVEDGYVVEAGKGLAIGGTVGRTTVKAGGDITIGGGAMGATIEASGSVAAKFFADCTVKAHQDVLAEEYILHSTVEAGHAVHVTKPDIGFIKGGVTRAGQEIVSAVVGSEVSESDTRLEVGLGIDTRARYDRLQPQMSNNMLTFDRGRKNVQYLQQKRETEGTLSVPQTEQLQNAIVQARKARDELFQSLEEHHTLLAGLAPTGGPGVVLVPALAHAATVVQVQRFQTRVTNPLQACGFTIVDGVLKVLDAPQVAKLMRMRKRGSAA